MAKSLRKIPRREVLAFIALQDAPMPLLVEFDWGFSPAISLKFDRRADATLWAAIFGVDMELRPARNHERAKWRGHDLWFTVPATEPAGEIEPIKVSDAARLREIAGGDQ